MQDSNKAQANATFKILSLPKKLVMNRRLRTFSAIQQVNRLSYRFPIVTIINVSFLDYKSIKRSKVSLVLRVWCFSCFSDKMLTRACSANVQLNERFETVPLPKFHIGCTPFTGTQIVSGRNGRQSREEFWAGVRLEG